jgi:hypothetical protein
MKKKIPNTFEELLTTYYSSHKQAVKSNTTRLDELLSSYYGTPPNQAGYGRPLGEADKHQAKPAETLALSMDDGETLPQPTNAADFEEYVVAKSLEDGNFEEYVVPERGLAQQSSWEGSRAAGISPNQEYLVDIFHSLSDGAQISPDAGKAPMSAPPASDQAPLAASTSPGAPSAPAPNSGPVQPPAKAGPTAPGSPTAPANPDTPVAPASPSDDDFLSDLQAILQGQKVYDPASGQTVSKEKLDRTQPAQTQAGSQSQKDQPAQQPENGQAIFDRIAQSMTYANAYDLGTVELNNRFADFDKLFELQQKQPEKKPASPPAATPPETAASASLDTANFLEDLQAIRDMARSKAPVETPADDSEGFSLPESLGPVDSFSRPMFDTGEHVLMGGDLYPNQLHVGRPSVAFSYGQIISMAADLYTNVQELIHAPAAELNKVKELVERSTLYYQGGKADKSLDVSNAKWDEVTNKRYLKLAEENFEHFSPNLYVTSPAQAGALPQHGDHYSAWKRHHHDAILEAQKLGKGVAFKETALVINAFGDHYLTDAFAAGHLINKNEMVYQFKANFYKGKELNSAAKDFFAKVAELAFTGDVRKKFSDLETYKPVIWWWHPNIDTTNAFRKLLLQIAEQRPDAVANLAVKGLHDYLNKWGVQVTNDAGDPPWKVTGDGFLNADTLAVAKKAVQQSVDNINDPAIYDSKFDFNAAYARVWKFVPKPTSDARQRIALFIQQDYTNPGSAILQQTAADLIKDQVDSLINKLKDEKKLRDA